MDTRYMTTYINKDIESATSEENAEMISRMRENPDDNELKELFCKKNSRLVYYFVSPYNFGDNLDDLMQVGMIGLLTAVEKYDSDKGSFSNYSASWIKKEVISLLRETSIIRLPNYISSKVSNFKRLIESGKSVDEIKNTLDINDDEYKQLFVYYKDFYSGHNSLDNPISEDNEFSLSDIKDVADEIDFEMNLVNEERREVVENVLKDALDDQELTVISMRFGLGVYNNPMSIKQIANELDITGSRALAILRKALRRLRHPRYKTRLFPYSEVKSKKIGTVNCNLDETGSIKYEDIQRIIAQK